MVTQNTGGKGAKKPATKKSAAKKSAAKGAAKKSAGQTATKNAGRASKSAGFKVGDRVRWDSSGGASVGKVVKVATTSGRIKDFEYKASKDDPRLIVETDDGARAAHKAEELRKA